MATADRMAQRAQAKRAAAAKRRGSEGPKQSKPSGRVQYVMKHGGGEESHFTLPKGVTPPKGAKKVAAGKPVRWHSASPQSSGVGYTLTRSMGQLKSQAERAKKTRRAAAKYSGSEGPKRSMPRKKK